MKPEVLDHLESLWLGLQHPNRTDFDRDLFIEAIREHHVFDYIRSLREESEQRGETVSACASALREIRYIVETELKKVP